MASNYTAPDEWGEDAWRKVAGLVEAGLAPWCEQIIDYHEIVEFRHETRLRFNALSPVATWTVRLRARGRDGRVTEGEAELFHWLIADEWELVELSGFA